MGFFTLSLMFAILLGALVMLGGVYALIFGGVLLVGMLFAALYVSYAKTREELARIEKKWISFCPKTSVWRWRHRKSVQIP